MQCMKEIPYLVKSFASELKIRRELCGMTQRQLAEKMDSTRSLISFLENEKNMPSLQTFFVIAQTLEVDPREFLDSIMARMASLKQGSS